MWSLLDDSSFDPVRRDRVEADCQQEAGRIDHLDLLFNPGSQRASEVTSVRALDYDPSSFTSRKECRQPLLGCRHIALKVS